LKRGDELGAVIEDLAVEGKSVARIDGFVVFVRGGVPGDTVRMRVRTVKRNFAEADLIALESPSPRRTEPRCRYFGTCGGCTWQNIAYSSQLEFKRRHVADTLERLGGFAPLAVPAPLAMADPFYYRNKMEFSFGERWRTDEEMAHPRMEGGATGEIIEPALGLHLPGRYDRVLDLEECWLQSESSARMVFSKVRSPPSAAMASRRARASRSSSAAAGSTSAARMRSNGIRNSSARRGLGWLGFGTLYRA